MNPKIVVMTIALVLTALIMLGCGASTEDCGKVVAYSVIPASGKIE